MNSETNAPVGKPTPPPRNTGRQLPQIPQPKPGNEGFLAPQLLPTQLLAPLPIPVAESLPVDSYQPPPVSEPVPQPLSNSFESSFRTDDLFPMSRPPTLPTPIQLPSTPSNDTPNLPPVVHESSQALPKPNLPPSLPPPILPSLPSHTPTSVDAAPQPMPAHASINSFHVEQPSIPLPNTLSLSSSAKGPLCHPSHPPPLPPTQLSLPPSLSNETSATKPHVEEFEFLQRGDHLILPHATKPNDSITAPTPEFIPFLPSPSSRPPSALPLPPVSLPTIPTEAPLERTSHGGEAKPAVALIASLPASTEPNALLPPSQSQQRNSNDAAIAMAKGLNLSDFVIVPDEERQTPIKFRGDGLMLASSRGEGTDEEDSDQPPPPDRFVAMPPKDKESLLRRESRFLSSLQSINNNKEPVIPLSSKAKAIPSEVHSQEEFEKYYNYSHCTIDFKVWKEPRDRVAYEILTSEVIYVKSLQILMSYLGPQIVKHCATYYDAAVVQCGTQLVGVLKDIQDIINVNNILFTSLKQRFEEWSNNQTLGDVFGGLAPFFGIYKQYSQSYGEFALIRREAEKNKNFSQFLDKLRTLPLCNLQGLENFLILPIQRVPRYVLLLSDFIKHTSETHPDRQDLEKALAETKNVAGNINDSIADHTNKMKCLQIQVLFSPEIQIVAPHRKFIAEGLLIKQCRKEAKPRQFFLFSDELIYGIPITGTSHFILSHRMSLYNAVVSSLEDDEANKIYNGIQIQGVGKGFTIYLSSAAEKEKWLKMFSMAVADEVTRQNTLRNSHNKQADKLGVGVVWKPDNLYSNCELCKSEFNLIFRKHHCRQCGSVVCGSCSSNRMWLQYYDKRSQERVCDRCFREKKKEASEKKEADKVLKL